MALSGILGPVAFGALTELDQQQQTSARLTGDITKAVTAQVMEDINLREKALIAKENQKSMFVKMYGLDTGNALDAAGVFSKNKQETENNIRQFLRLSPGSNIGPGVSDFKKKVEQAKKINKEGFDKFLKQSAILAERKSLRERSDFVSSNSKDTKYITDLLLGPRKRGGILGSLVTDRIRERDVPAATARLTDAFAEKPREETTDTVVGTSLFGISGAPAGVDPSLYLQYKKAAEAKFDKRYTNPVTKRVIKTKYTPKEPKKGEENFKNKLKFFQAFQDLPASDKEIYYLNEFVKDELKRDEQATGIRLTQPQQPVTPQSTVPSADILRKQANDQILKFQRIEQEDKTYDATADIEEVKRILERKLQEIGAR
jgi:hypothetical protein